MARRERASASGSVAPAAAGPQGRAAGRDREQHDDRAGGERIGGTNTQAAGRSGSRRGSGVSGCDTRRPDGQRRQAREARPRAQAAAGRKTRRRKPRRSRTALVLGGGGFTGGVYEIGALRALDLLAVNRTVNQFDVYVGTSAGSFVAASPPTGSRPRR